MGKREGRGSRMSFLEYAVKYIASDRRHSPGNKRGVEQHSHTNIYPDFLFPFLSRALRRLCPSPIWLEKGRIVEMFDSSEKHFPFGTFLDEEFQVIVDVYPQRGNIHIRVDSPDPALSENFLKRLEEEFKEVFVGGYFQISYGVSRVERVDSFPELGSLSLDGKKLERIHRDIIGHFDLVPHLKKRGYSTSLSVLFHGRPGTGKTYTIKAIVKEFVRRGIPVFNMTGMDPSEFIAAIGFFDFLPRAVFIYEDIDTVGVRGRYSYHDYIQSSYLSLLDGLNEVDNRILIFTTNFYEELDEAFKRPGRIDLTLRFEAEPEEVIASVEPLMKSAPEDFRKSIRRLILEKRLTYAEAHSILQAALKREIYEEKLPDYEELRRHFQEETRTSERTKRLGFGG